MASNSSGRFSFPNWLVVGLVITIGVAWAANFFARFILPGYSPHIAVDGMMTLILAAALGAGLLRGGKSDG